MLSFKAIRSQLSRWLRLSSQPGPSTARSEPRPVPTTMPTSLYFYPHKMRSLDTDSGIGSSRPPTIYTPDSTRSVYFDDAISWPYIDEETDNCT